jgi:hypothetical protein
MLGRREEAYLLENKVRKAMYSWIKAFFRVQGSLCSTGAIIKMLKDNLVRGELFTEWVWLFHRKTDVAFLFSLQSLESSENVLLLEFGRATVFWEV